MLFFFILDVICFSSVPINLFLILEMFSNSDSLIKLLRSFSNSPSLKDSLKISKYESVSELNELFIVMFHWHSYSNLIL